MMVGPVRRRRPLFGGLTINRWARAGTWGKHKRGCLGTCKNTCALDTWLFLAFEYNLMAYPAIHVFLQEKQDLENLLDQRGIEWQWRSPPGQIMDAGGTIEIVKITGDRSLYGTIAWVIVEWLKNKGTRKALIITKNLEIQHLEGRSLEEVALIIESCKTISLIDTEKKERNNDSSESSSRH
jgi:hypothetical protein